MKRQLNLQRGIFRIGVFTGLIVAIINILYATQEGLLYSWSYITHGVILQNQIALWMVRFGLGEMPQLGFLITHTIILSSIIGITTYFFLNLAWWCFSGFKKEREDE